MAAGLADDLATTALLATDKPVLVAPAMNVRMWEHAATRANIECLAGRGVLRVPIMARNERVSLSLTNCTPGGCRVSSMEWEGKLTQRSRRI